MRARRAPVGGWPIAAALAVAAVMLYAIRYALLPFVFAIAIAFIVDPAVVALARWLGGRRWIAAALVYVLVVLVLATIVYWLLRTAASDVMIIARQGDQLATELLSRLLGSGAVRLFGQAYTPAEMVEQAERAASAALGIGALARVAGAGLAVVFGGVMLLVLTPYFMISGPRLSAGAVWLVPPERRHSIEHLLPRLLPVLRRYLVGVLAVVSYTAFVGWIGFGLIFGLPHAPLLSIVVGVLEIIPVIGPVTAATLAGLAAFQHAGSLVALAGPVAFIIALRLSIDNLAGPLLLGQAAHIHPVVVMFAFVCGAMLFGAIGLLLAVPAAVTLKLALQHYYAEPVAAPGSRP
ncbi:MAG TPA: AI-2E family transporter [Stellaceae bacterium]|nr:AI-2E family transporter [Stellaceae bacterium]